MDDFNQINVGETAAGSASANTRRVQVAEVVGSRVRLYLDGVSPSGKLYSYPKGITPELTDKVYLTKSGSEEIIITVHEGGTT